MSCCKIPKLLMNFSLCVTGVFVAVFVIVISNLPCWAGFPNSAECRPSRSWKSGGVRTPSAGGVVAVESDRRSLSVMLSARLCDEHIESSQFCMLFGCQRTNLITHIYKPVYFWRFFKHEIFSIFAHWHLLCVIAGEVDLFHNWSECVFSNLFRCHFFLSCCGCLNGWSMTPISAVVNSIYKLSTNFLHSPHTIQTHTQAHPQYFANNAYGISSRPNQTG